jgi:hypothetical protein
MKKEDIRENVLVILGLLSVLSLLIGAAFVIASSLGKQYYYINKSQILNYNSVLYQIKTGLKDRYSTKDSLVTSLDNVLSFKDLKKYGDFIKSAIKEKKDESLGNTFFYLDSSIIKSVSKVAGDSIISLNNKKYIDEDELRYNLQHILPKSYYNHFGNILKNGISYGSLSNNFFDKFSGWLLIPGFIILVIVIIIISEDEKKKKKNTNNETTEKELEAAKEQIKNEPNKIKPSWDMAYLTLQQYFEKNLQHINSIYRISINVMIVGFVIIGLGIFISYFGKDKDISIISISSGILIEFIGATFLFIFKSTVKQALKYSRTLEKINNVGMSMKILDTIETSEIDKEELIKAKIEISKILISNSKEK